jgi:hypothetical protein
MPVRPQIRRMQPGARITRHRPVVRVNDGFKEVHKISNSTHCGHHELPEHKPCRNHILTESDSAVF